MEQVIWKDIPTFEGLYQAGSNGCIKSLSNNKFKKEKIIVPYVTDKGYQEVSLSKLNKRKSYRVNRLVALVFLSNPESKSHVNHKNGIKSDNRVVNLEWNTPSENMRHSFEVLKRKGSNLGLLGKLNKQSKPVYQLDAKTNEVVNEFYAVMEAQRLTGILASHICQVANKNTIRKTAGKYKWEWK